MISMEMGEDNKIKRWQFIDTDGRVCQPCGIESIPQMDFFMHVYESGIGQDSKSCITDKDCRISYKEN
jgi:hypothetical protein